LVFEDGYVKLADFGLSRILKGESERFEKLGMPFYFSPELVLESECGLSMDLWSLGVLAYELGNF
jgi:serine/threonine protein kinase